MNRDLLIKYISTELNLNANYLELGVYKGDYSSKILKYSNCKQLYLVDIWKQLQNYDSSLNVENSLQEKIYQSVKNKYSANSRVKILRELSIDASLMFDDNFFDFIYIDANHSYDAVKSDMLQWYPKLKSGGVLAGHDYVEDGIYPNNIFGVKSAVNEFVELYNLQLHITTEDWPSWYIIKT